MYKIIGADHKEYGPITAAVLRQWIAQGRANAQTSVLAEGSGDWKPLADFPELAAALPIAMPPSLSVPPSGSQSAADLVNGPGIGLIVTGALNVIFGALRVILSLTGLGLGLVSGTDVGNDAITKLLMSAAGTAGIVVGALCAVSGVATLLAGLKLRKLESYGLCVTGCILGMIPCLSICCWIGLPIGIWALVTMSKPEVKSQFR